MKLCPQCGNRYSDDSLLYCLQDGTPLAADPRTGTMSETPTVIGSDRETVPVTVVNPSPGAAAPPHRSRTGLIVAVVVGVVLLLLVGAGLGALVFMRNRSAVTVNVNTASQPSSPTPAPKPTATPTATPKASPSPSPKNSVKNDQIAADISSQIEDWASSLSARDLDGLMENYADKVDYFTKPGISRSAVRADKERALTLYDEMDVQVSNISVLSNDEGTSATATFDKEWRFTGENTSEGKTRSQLDLKYSNGVWLITAERDLKVYYKR